MTKYTEHKPFDSKWDMYFLELKKFKEKFGHCDVPECDKKYTRLANWCNRQRRLRKHELHSLLPERVKKLNGLRFSWSPLETHWQNRFEELKKFKEKFGHCNAARSLNYEQNSLSKWVGNQRRSYEKKSAWLTPEKINKLNSLGFLWKSPNKIGRQSGSVKISDEELLNDLKRLNEKLKRIPSSGDIIKHGNYATITYIARFGSIYNARNKAGFDVDKIIHKYDRVSDEELLSDLKRLHKVLKKNPSERDIKEHGKYGHMTYHLRFGTIANAREKAGLDREFEQEEAKITDKELLNDLVRLQAVLKKIPTKGNIIEYGKYSTTTYYKRFGSIKVAREKAGVGYVKKPKDNKESDVLDVVEKFLSKRKK